MPRCSHWRKEYGGLRFANPSHGLKLRDPLDRDVAIRMYAPERAEVDWVCRFEIDWPEQKAERWGAGIDGVQAMISALQMIGAEIYARAESKSGKLEWLEPGRGYGFPVPANVRDLLVGDDKQFF